MEHKLKVDISTIIVKGLLHALSLNYQSDHRRLVVDSVQQVISDALILGGEHEMMIILDNHSLIS